MSIYAGSEACNSGRGRRSRSRDPRSLELLGGDFLIREMRRTSPLRCVLDSDGADVSLHIYIEKCVLVQITRLRNRSIAKKRYSSKYTRRSAVPPLKGGSGAGLRPSEIQESFQSSSTSSIDD